MDPLEPHKKAHAKTLDKAPDKTPDKAQEGSGDCPAPCEGRKRGRPPRGTAHLRREEMLRAAANVFMEQGFEAASMEAVAKAAGISKKTIYAFVATKEQLFEEVMKAHATDKDRPALDASPTSVDALEEALADFLSRLAHFILGPFAVGLFRLTIAESERFPHIAHTFYREGALRSIHQLEDWLQLQYQKGLLNLDDVHEGAVMLTSMVILEPLRAAAMGVAPLPSHEAMEKRAHTAARIFVRGVAASQPG